VRSEEATKGRKVADVGLNQGEVGMLEGLGKVSAFDSRIVERVEIVDTDHVEALGEEVVH